MNLLRDTLGRNMLVPALRLMRAQLRAIPEPQRLRALALRFDAMAGRDRDLVIAPVTAGSVPASWIDPPGVRADRVVLYLHGGAFVAETPNFHGALLARICAAAGARGLMPSYRLAPEYRYPAALDDCLGAYRWLLDQGLAAANIIVAGDSAGGNLTLALLLRLRDEALPLPAGAVALSPVTDFTFSGDSVRRNDGIDDMFAAESMSALVPIYLAQTSLRTHPHVSPLFGDYSGLPPLLLVVGSTELLLDDSVRVAQRCAGAQLLVWHGMPHVFPGFGFLPEAREATQRIGEFMRRCLDLPADSPAPEQAWDKAPDLVPDPAERVPVAALAKPASPRPPFGAVAWLYLTLAAISGAVSLSLLLAWPALVLANPVVWAATAATALFMLIEAGTVGWRRLLGCLAATVLLGPGCGLSLFLFLRTRRAAPAPHAGTRGGADNPRGG